MSFPRLLGYCIEETGVPRPHRCAHVHDQPEQAATCHGRLGQRTYEIVRAIRVTDGCVITQRNATELGANEHDRRYLEMPVDQIVLAPPPPQALLNVSSFPRARRRARR